MVGVPLLQAGQLCAGEPGWEAWPRLGEFYRLGSSLKVALASESWRVQQDC